jgi:8-oxo-dGTP pyrophosphatase MutT (NUDIX family)
MAGILPYIQDKTDDTIYFLFGRERINNNQGCADNGLWSDFGGSRDKGETLKTCAIREGSEELCGFLSKSIIKERISSSISIDTYTTYLVYLNYDKHRTLPDYLNAHYEFMSRQQQIKPLIKDPNNGLYEKDKFAWFSLKDIREKREQFRPFYRDVLDLIVAEFGQ